MANTYQNQAPQVDTANNWFQRIIAAVIDSIPWWIVATILQIVLLSPAMVFGGWAFGLWWLIWLFIWPLIYGIPLFIYCYIMENGANAATFGKKIMGLQVQKVGGGKANSGQIMKRNISKILWFVFIIDIVLGFVTQGPDPRQRYFDRMAGTTVISTKDVFGAAAAPPPPPPPPE